MRNQNKNKKHSLTLQSPWNRKGEEVVNCTPYTDQPPPYVRWKHNYNISG